MSRLRKSMARGENVGWVSRKDSNTMDRVVGAVVTSIYFHGVHLSPVLPGLLENFFFPFSSFSTIPFEKASEGLFLGLP